MSSRIIIDSAMSSNVRDEKIMSRPRWIPCRFVLSFCLACGLLSQAALAAEDSLSSALPRNRFRSGEETLSAFAPVCEATRYLIVRFNVDGETVALGTIVDTNGLALTKASEIKKGKLTCWLAVGKEANAEVLAIDQEEDVALVQVHADGLKPIQWSEDQVSVGQWAVTPGITETPHAVGIVSSLPRRIRPERAYVGVRFDVHTQTPTIDEILPGLGAEKAGLQRGDVIKAVNHADVTNREQVVEMIRDFREGQTINLQVQRTNELFGVDIGLMVPRSGQLSRDLYRQQEFSRLTGQVSHRAEGFEQAIQHDTVLQPWLCGGPLVNLDGKAIGLNIARAGRVASYALPAELVKRIFENLKSAPRAVE
jgi:serine protease Do